MSRSGSPTRSSATYVPLSNLSSREPRASHPTKFDSSPIDDPALYSAFDDPEYDELEDQPGRPATGWNRQSHNSQVSKSPTQQQNPQYHDGSSGRGRFTFIPDSAEIDNLEDGGEGGAAVVSLLGSLSGRKGEYVRFDKRKGETQGPEQLPEQDFLNLILHQGSLDDVQELCRARLDYLVDADDARKLQRTPFYKVALYRFPAILITLSLELVVAGIITSHKTATKGSPITKENEFLFSFAPVLSSMSGNIGLQASTTTLRALATGHASSKSLQDIMRVLLREFLCAFLIGLVSSCALIGIGDLWTQSVPFGLVTGMSLMVSASLGGIIGCSGPIIFKKLGIDPAVTAGPFETAVQDMISYSVYLGLARMFLYGT